MAQQPISNGDSGLLARTKINSNDTELFARQDTPIANATEYIYVKGDASTDDSLRTSVDAVTGFTKIEKRISGVWEETTQQARTLDFNTTLAVSEYKAGRISYDSLCKCLLADTGYTNVRVNIGREFRIEVFNNTGVLISNGDPISVDGTFTGIIPNGVPTDTTSILNTLGFAGVATMDIPAGESGIVTAGGLVRDMNTQALATGFIYADASGWYTQTRPTYPNERLIVGAVIKTGVTDGIIQVNSQHIPRRTASRSYSFSSSGVGAGTHYAAGFYQWASTSVTLNQGSLTQTYATALRTKAAHVGIVAAGPGTVDTGQVGLRVTGIMDSEEGLQLAAQTAIITDDITTLTANEMKECLEKFSGQITISLYVVSGTPTAYSLTFNYGYSKYEDFANIDGTVTALSVDWLAGATDNSFDISLKYHNPAGWTYAASGFIPGNGNICNRLTDQALAPNLASGSYGAYKRTNLSQFIDGSGLEGIIIELKTNAPGTITNLNAHVVAFSEELF